jgi:hypothetical protein
MVDYLAKDINSYFREDFRDQGTTLYSLRQVIGLMTAFVVKVEADPG